MMSTRIACLTQSICLHCCFFVRMNFRVVCLQGWTRMPWSCFKSTLYMEVQATQMVPMFIGKKNAGKPHKSQIEDSTRSPQGQKFPPFSSFLAAIKLRPTAWAGPPVFMSMFQLHRDVNTYWNMWCAILFCQKFNLAFVRISVKY